MYQKEELLLEDREETNDDTHADAHSLLRVIRTLPPKFRPVVLLRYARQLSFYDIAQILSMPEATAKTYMQRAKSLLRAALMVEMPADDGCMNWL